MVDISEFNEVLGCRWESAAERHYRAKYRQEKTAHRFLTFASWDKGVSFIFYLAPCLTCQRNLSQILIVGDPA